MNFAKKLIHFDPSGLGKKPQAPKGNLNVFGEVRTRLLIYYMTLIVGLLGLSIPLFSKLILNEVNIRVRRDLREELESFKKFMETEALSKNSLQSDELIDILDDFLYYRIPEDDTFLIIIIDGALRISSPKALPIIIQENSDLMKSWVTLKHEEQGEQKTEDSDMGNILYLATPIVNQGQVRGVFVAVHATAGEIQEATDLIAILIRVFIGILVIAFILTWIVSGQVLAPLRSLARTARSISDTDLTQRLSLQGTGELAELALSFNEMMDRIQSSFDTQKAFISDAGHELRTPITIIQGHLELLIYDNPEEQQKTIALILDELDRMVRMVKELLLLAKSERPDFLNLEVVDVNLLTQELFTKAQALAPRQWRLGAIAQGTFMADRQRVTQAIMNLAENATQHTKETDIIEIGSAFENEMIHLWVVDSGEGIAESDQHRVFERFARVVGRQRRSEGTGLGLSIVKAIAQAHGGEVQLSSQLTVGSTFILVLPSKLSWLTSKRE
jgi:signal transduction histidine kinase